MSLNAKLTAVLLLVASGVVVGTPADVTADVSPSVRVCFEVAGSPGDAAIVNLTPVEASGPGFGLLVSSDVSNPPVASNVNFVGPASVDPNVAVARIGTDGGVCFVNSELSSVDLVADHLGTIDGDAYTPAKSDGTPDRKLDTRPVPAPTTTWNVIDDGAPARCIELVERVNAIIAPYLMAADLNGTITVSLGPSGVLSGSAGGSSIRIVCSPGFLPETGVHQVVTHEFMHVIQGNIVADWIWPYADHVQFGVNPNTGRSLFEHQADTMARLACDRVGLACSSGAYGELPEQIPDSAKLLEYVGL